MASICAEQGTTAHVRPRVLYWSLFSWMAITGGRFLAPFLEHESEMTDSNIGLILGIQYAILSVLAPYYGKRADAQERKYPNYGRGSVVVVGIICGSISFLMHGLNTVWDLPIFDSLYFHYAVQVLYAINFAAVIPVLDGMTLDFLQKEQGGSLDYGKERLHGAISWGVTNMILGPLIDKFGFPVYYPCCVISAVYSIGSIYVYSNAQARAQARKQRSDSDFSDAGAPKGASELQTDSLSEPKADASPSSLSLLWGVINSAYGAAFVFCYFFMTLGFSVVENLVFLFFEYLGGSNTICSITVVLTVIFEVPIFQIAPDLLRKHGVGWMLLLACITFWIRIVGYTLIPEGSTWMVLLIEPLHGFTYAGSQVAAVEYVNRNMPEGSEASGQGIVNLIRGSANVVGLWLGGFLQDAFGPRVMYRVFVAAVTVGISVFATVRSTHRQQEAGYRIVAEATEN